MEKTGVKVVSLCQVKKVHRSQREGSKRKNTRKSKSYSGACSSSVRMGTLFPEKIRTTGRSMNVTMRKGRVGP